MQLNDINLLASKILRRELKDFGVVGVEVQERLNADDEPSLYIEATLKEKNVKVPGEYFGIAMVALKQALYAEGDERFPYLTLRRPGDEYAIDDSPHAG